jgi:hypothetical protein
MYVNVLSYFPLFSFAFFHKNQKVGARLRLVAYGTIGRFKVIFAFLGFYYALAHYGISAASTVGTAQDWGSPYDDVSANRQAVYDQLCTSNSVYQGALPRVEFIHPLSAILLQLRTVHLLHDAQDGRSARLRRSSRTRHILLYQWLRTVPTGSKVT